MAMWKQNHTIIVLNNTTRWAREYILIFVICPVFLFVWKCSRGRGKVSAFTGSCLANVAQGQIQTEINRPTKSLGPLLCPCELRGWFAYFKWELGWCLSLPCLGAKTHLPTAYAWLLLPLGESWKCTLDKADTWQEPHPTPEYRFVLWNRGHSPVVLAQDPQENVMDKNQSSKLTILHSGSSPINQAIASCFNSEIPFLHLSSEGNDTYTPELLSRKWGHAWKVLVLVADTVLGLIKWYPFLNDYYHYRYYSLTVEKSSW